MILLVSFSQDANAAWRGRFHGGWGPYYRPYIAPVPVPAPAPYYRRPYYAPVPPPVYRGRWVPPHYRPTPYGDRFIPGHYAQ